MTTSTPAAGALVGHLVDGGQPAFVSTSPVLVHGQTGTGKTVLAAALARAATAGNSQCWVSAHGSDLHAYDEASSFLTGLDRVEDLLTAASDVAAFRRGLPVTAGSAPWDRLLLVVDGLGNLADATAIDVAAGLRRLADAGIGIDVVTTMQAAPRFGPVRRLSAAFSCSIQLTGVGVGVITTAAGTTRPVAFLPPFGVAGFARDAERPATDGSNR